MIFLYEKIRADFNKNPFIGKRFVFEVGDAKEKAESAEIPEEEKMERRKQQARGEIDAIYESGKYDTYNFRKLPQEFKDRMRDNFGEWIDGNITKYDKDKDSGINAAEYAEFKSKLNEKVEEILDRLIEAKDQKKKDAEQVKENAEQAQEAQKRLAGVDTSKLNEANLENEDGCYTELLSYQKDFEKEASGFTALAGVFSGAKEQAENANKSHYTGATAFGEMLVSWVEDIPEVKSAKDAKEKAVADFRTRLAEMKTRQKERQARGTRLNGAPEKIRGQVLAQYEEEKNKTREDLELAKKAEEENLREKVRLEAEVKLNDERRKAAQKEYDMLAIRLQQAQQKKTEVEKRTGEMRETATGFGILAERARKEQGGPGGAERGQPSRPGQMSAEQIERQALNSAAKAREATGQLETGLAEADKAVGGMSGSTMVIQRRLADLNSDRKSITSDILKRDMTGTLLTEAVTGLDDRMDKLSDEESQRIEQVDTLDAAIAETVIQVDTSNFELVKKGDEYMKMLASLDISGPGLLDTAGAMIMGIPGAETAYNWSGDKLSGAWKWAKEAPVLKYAIGGAEDMGKDWVKMWDALGDGLSWVGDKLHLKDAWDWMDNASKHLSIGNPTGNPLADAILDTTSGGGLGTIIEVFAGVTSGAVGLVQVVGMMLQNPFKTIKGLGGILNHPGKLIDALIQKDKWGDESSGKIIGRAIFDVIATLSGGGAAATSFKTAMAAMKLGGMGAGKAFLLALKTFGKVFFEDLGKTAIGVIKSPVTILKGGADLFKWLARGGKKSPETIRMAALNKAKITAREEEALRGLESARNNPGEFVKWLQKYPDQVDIAYKIMKTESKAAKAADKAEKAQRKSPRTELNETAKEAKATKSTKKETKKERPEGPPENAPDSATSESPNTAPPKPALQLNPDFKLKKMTAERREMIASLEEATVKSDALKAVGKKLKTEELTRLMNALPDDELRLLANSLENLDSTMIERILRQDYRYFTENGEVVRFYVGEQLGKGGFGVVSDCAFVKGAGGKLEIEAVKIQRSFEPFKAEIERTRAMMREGRLSPEETGLTRKRIENLHNRLKTEELKPDIRANLAKEIDKLEKRLSEVVMSEQTRADFGRRIADLNKQMEDINIGFAREKNGLALAAEIDNNGGLLHVRHMSGAGSEHMIVFDRVAAIPGEAVNWEGRMADIKIPVEQTIGDLQSVIGTLDNLHANGLIHGDFNGRQILVGMVDGKRSVILGDLAMMPVDQLAMGVGIKLSETRVSGRSVSFKLFDSAASSTGSIAGTPGFFSIPHLKKLVEELNESVNKAKTAGRDATKIEVAKDVVALGDNNALGVTIRGQREFFEVNRTALQKSWGIDAATFDAVLRDYDSVIKRLTDSSQTVPYAEVIEQLEKAKQRITGGRAPS
jgi:hypothetical protein